MCDGYIEESWWTVRSRVTGQELQTESGYTYIFSAEAEAREFLSGRVDSLNLELVEVRNPT